MIDFENFEHKADIGVRGYGKMIEEAFENGAKAMFFVAVNLDKVEPKEEVEIKCEAENLEELFVEWLNQLLAEAGVRNFVFCDFFVKEIKKENFRYRLIGGARGEEFNPEKHEPKVEVKAATYSELKVEKINDKYLVQTIVDI